VPAIPTGVHVFIGVEGGGLGVRGRVDRTVLRPDGTWSSPELILGSHASEPPASPSPATWDPFEQHVVAVVPPKPPPWPVPEDAYVAHALEWIGGARTGAGNVEAQAGDRGDFVRVTADGFLSFPEGPGPWAQLQVCGVTKDGKLWHTQRDLYGSWTPFIDVEQRAGDRGFITWVDCSCGMNLHICAVSSDGGLWYTLREVYPFERWLDFFDIKSQAGDPGAFRAVSCSATTGGIYLVALASDSKIWYTQAGIGPSFRFVPFEQVLAPPQPKIDDIACKMDREGFHVCVIGSKTLYYTLRPWGTISWRPWINVAKQWQVAHFGGGIVSVGM
jgi:hypothetical protein